MTETTEELLRRLGRHPRDCPGGCRGNAYIKVPIPPEKRGVICYDHWDYYDYVPCNRGVQKAPVRKIKGSKKRRVE